MTIDELNALTTLTDTDEVPVWDSEESGDPTKKITASNLAASVKSLGNLIGTGDLDSTPTQGSSKAVTSGGVYTAIQQSTAIDTHTSYAPTYCYEIKCGKIVTVYGHSAGGLTLTGNNSWQTLTTLPAGFRPTTDVYGVGASAAGTAITFHVAPNGLVEWVAGTGLTTSYWNFGLVFVAAE